MRRCTRQRCAGVPDHISRLIILRYRRRPVGSSLPWPVTARGPLLIAIFERDRYNKGIRAADLRQRGETFDKSGPDRNFRSCAKATTGVDAGRRQLELNLFSYIQGVVHLNREIPDSALQFGMTEEKLDCTQVSGLAINLGSLRAAH
jgi:hypothetical protein